MRIIYVDFILIQTRSKNVELSKRGAGPGVKQFMRPLEFCIIKKKAVMFKFNIIGAKLYILKGAFLYLLWEYKTINTF
jgi:hypothetical protein